MKQVQLNRNGGNSSNMAQINQFAMHSGDDAGLVSIRQNREFFLPFYSRYDRLS